MLMSVLALVLAVPMQQAPPAPKPELAVISARLGSCAADFTVTGADGTPVYAASIHVRIRYGFLGLKRMDLEVGTNSDGKARVDTLPVEARPLVYDISKGTLKTTVEQNLTTGCQASFAVSLK